jgi:DNA invertase Pin-like site-specific DNA recombinase
MPGGAALDCGKIPVSGHTVSALGGEAHLAHFCVAERLDFASLGNLVGFTLLSAVAELERSLIVERVRAGLRNARAKCKTLGRLRKVVDPGRITSLREQGHSLRSIASELGIGLATLYRSAPRRSNTREREFGTR